MQYFFVVFFLWELVGMLCNNLRLSYTKSNASGYAISTEVVSHYTKNS